MTEHQDIIRKFSEIELPSEIIDIIDLEKIAKEYKKKFKKLDKYKEYKKDRDEAWFGKKWWLTLSGEDSDQLKDAVISQSELLKMNSELIVLNTIFAKELNRQQKQIDVQQKEIKGQNDEIKDQQTKLEEQANELDEQQKRILDLVHLTDGQEKAIKDLRDRAQRVEELESEFNENLKSLKQNAQEFKDQTEKGFKNLERENKINHNLIIESSNDLNTLINKMINEEKSVRSSEITSLHSSLGTIIKEIKDRNDKLNEELLALKSEITKTSKSSSIKINWSFAISIVLFVILFIKIFIIK